MTESQGGLGRQQRKTFQRTGERKEFKKNEEKERKNEMLRSK